MLRRIMYEPIVFGGVGGIAIRGKELTFHVVVGDVVVGAASIHFHWRRRCGLRGTFWWDLVALLVTGGEGGRAVHVGIPIYLGTGGDA